MKQVHFSLLSALTLSLTLVGCGSNVKLNDVAVEDRVLLQFAAVCHRDVAFDFAKDDHGAGLDVPDDPGVLPDSEVTFGVHFSLDTAVDDEVAGKAKPAFDLHIA